MTCIYGFFNGFLIHSLSFLCLYLYPTSFVPSPTYLSILRSIWFMMLLYNPLAGTGFWIGSQNCSFRELFALTRPDTTPSTDISRFYHRPRSRSFNIPFSLQFLVRPSSSTTPPDPCLQAGLVQNCDPDRPCARLFRPFVHSNPSALPRLQSRPFDGFSGYSTPYNCRPPLWDVSEYYDAFSASKRETARYF